MLKRILSRRLGHEWAIIIQPLALARETLSSTLFRGVGGAHWVIVPSMGVYYADTGTWKKAQSWESGVCTKAHESHVCQECSCGYGCSGRDVAVACCCGCCGCDSGLLWLWLWVLAVSVAAVAVTVVCFGLL